MKILIEAPARNDLVEGYRFYEGSGEGLGEYFLADSLHQYRIASDI